MDRSRWRLVAQIGCVGLWAAAIWFARLFLSAERPDNCLGIGDSCAVEEAKRRAALPTVLTLDVGAPWLWAAIFIVGAVVIIAATRSVRRDG